MGFKLIAIPIVMHNPEHLPECKFILLANYEVVMGLVYEHRDLGDFYRKTNPETNLEVIGAGNICRSDMGKDLRFYWSSDGYHLTTPDEYRGPIMTFLLGQEITREMAEVAYRYQ